MAFSADETAKQTTVGSSSLRRPHQRSLAIVRAPAHGAVTWRVNAKQAMCENRCAI